MNDTIDFQIVTENISSVLEPQARVVENISPSWNFIVVFFAMLFVLLNKQLYYMRFRMMLSVLTHPSDNDRTNGLTVFVSYIAMLALVVQKIIVIYSGKPLLYNNFSFYLDICAFIALVCILRHLVISLYGWLFDVENATTHHEMILISSMTVINMVMIVLGLMIICYPTKFILILTFSIVLIIMAIRIIKTFFDFQILSKMNLLNNFLYFCTLEIIPLSVAITMLYRLIVTDCVL